MTKYLLHHLQSIADTQLGINIQFINAILNSLFLFKKCICNLFDYCISNFHDQVIILKVSIYMYIYVITYMYC